MSFLREQMRVLLSIAREDLESDSTVQPFAVAFVAGVMKIRLLGWKSLEQRRRVQAEVRHWMEQSHADCGIIMAESWIKLGPHHDPSKSLANDPESHECIIITGASTEEHLILLQTFEKGPDGSFTFSSPQWFGAEAGETMTDEWLGGVSWAKGGIE